MSMAIIGSLPLGRRFETLFIPDICYIDPLDQLIQKMLDRL